MLRHIRILAVPILLIVFGCKFELGTQTYSELVKEAMDTLRLRNDKLKKSYKIGQYTRFEYDQMSGELIWSDDGIPQVVARFQSIGSFDPHSKTWMWAWTNESILPALRLAALKVRDFGEAKGYGQLTIPLCKADEVDAWEMSAVSLVVTDSLGVYRGKGTNRSIPFLLITDIRWASNAPPTGAAK